MHFNHSHSAPQGEKLMDSDSKDSEFEEEKKDTAEGDRSDLTVQMPDLFKVTLDENEKEDLQYFLDNEESVTDQTREMMTLEAKSAGTIKYADGEQKLTKKQVETKFKEFKRNLDLKKIRVRSIAKKDEDFVHDFDFNRIPFFLTQTILENGQQM
jgi:hypothetical protein